MITCPEESDSDYEITWPSISANMNATISCPNAAGNADCIYSCTLYIVTKLNPMLIALYKLLIE